MIKKKFKTCLTTVKIQNVERPGVALLVVLFIVMVITILSLGFLSRSDVELACGENMVLRTQMDYLAESGLEHARGLILNPQEVSSEYWTGGVGQQIAGGNDYYDIRVVRDDSDPAERCNYIIDCNAYRLKNGEKIGQSNVKAQLRLDPCIAYWMGSSATISQRVTINGDVYCAGNLFNSGNIGGDVFADGIITGVGIEGQKNTIVAQPPVNWPGVQVSDFSSTYYIGSASYLPDIVGSYLHPSGSFLPSANNPGGIRYRNGDVELPGNVNITGMLAVNGNLRISGSNNTITAVKNFPALVVSGDVIVETGGRLEINGLAVLNGKMQVSSGGAIVNVLGGLFAQNDIVETTSDSSGNGNAARLYSSPTWRPSGGQTGGALEFDGVDDYAQTSNDAGKLQLTGDYTLSLWIKADATQKSWAGVFSKCSPDGSTNHWTVQFDSSNPKKLVIHHPDHLPPPRYWDTGIGLNNIAGAWHHVGIVRNGNTMTSYLDGVKLNTGTWANAPGSGDGHFNIGVDRTAFATYVYKGLIDDIRIYNCALDVNDIYPPRDGLAGLIGHWKLDESGSSITITAEPCETAILMWSSGGAITKKWEQAAGAFFRSIQRE
jgi:cytoskeletal protein CcmA (bactofilin family)